MPGLSTQSVLQEKTLPLIHAMKPCI